MNAPISAALSYLTCSQRDNGSFPALASPSPDDFRSYRYHPTPFFTSLILGCLDPTHIPPRLRQRGVAFLLSERSEEGTWNYWRRKSQRALRQPYPDDLDDTACALIALHKHQPELIDGVQLAKLAACLIACEQTPGGPYKTWLVDPESMETWQDIDCAVQANVGFLLSQLETNLPGLNRFLETAIMENSLQSRYYLRPDASWYFLARWYKGSQRQVLASYLDHQLPSITAATDPLWAALNLSSSLRLSGYGSEQTRLYNELCQCQQADGSWPAQALYMEPQVQGDARYAGSAALTTAFCVEALSLYRQHSHNTPLQRQKIEPLVITTALRDSRALQEPLRAIYQAYLRKLAQHDRDGQVTYIADIARTALGASVAPSQIQALNCASLHGWLAYTIYDDFLDQEASPNELPCAHSATRRMLDAFREAHPDRADFQRYVEQALTRMDQANTWETMSARALIRDQVLELPQQLPVYRGLYQLADRSWGHILATIGVFVSCHYQLAGPEIAAYENFFRHFLIARQLNDDAHDWEEDLRAGHLTAVVVKLVKSTSQPSIHLVDQLPQLRQKFWVSTIVEVSRLIQRHTAQAREYLLTCQVISDPSIYLHWLDGLDHSAQAALHERTKALSFIKTFQA